MTDYVVSSGVISSGFTLLSGDSLTVLAGGTADFITVSAGGSATVEAGGIANNTTVDNFGAVLSVEGSTTGTVLNSGGEENIYAGGIAVGTTINLAGYEQIYSGGVTSGVVINGGGGQFVYSSGSSISAVVYSGGAEYDYVHGTASDTTIENGGVVLVQPTGVVTDPVVEPGGQIVSTGVAVYTPATGLELLGAVASGSTIGGDEAREYVLAGGTAIGNTIEGTVDQEVYSGGTTSATLVNSGGTERVESGASAIGTTVASGGLERVLIGGTDTDDTVNPGGYQLVSYGGLAEDTTVAGGYQFVSDGGRVEGTTVTAGDGIGGYEVVSDGGSAVSATVDGSGEQWIESGGVALDTTVNSGGYQEVFAGSTVISSTVGAGATEYVYSRGIVDDTALSSGGTIDLTYVTYESGGVATLDSSTDVLTVDVGGSTTILSLAGDYAGHAFQLTSDVSTGTDVTLTTIPCFALGTSILTEHGEVAVEQLRVGDRVKTYAGDTRRIAWIGQRDILCARHAHPETVLPVRVAAHAFGVDRPHRDLLLSPDHAIFTEGVLVPVRVLVNGDTIRQIQQAQITYFHIELETHDVLVANELPAESYLDTGDRDSFADGPGPVTLHPAFGSERCDITLVMDALGFAPLRVTGAEVEAAKTKLRANGAAASATQGAKAASMPA